jgi:hypothetical protein
VAKMMVVQVLVLAAKQAQKNVLPWLKREECA